MEELEKQGVKERRLGSKLKALHSKNKQFRKKMIFVVQLTPTDKNTHVFLGPKLKNYFRLTPNENKTLRISGMDPDPKFKVWNVYEYPPGRPRRFNRPHLMRLTKPLTLTLDSTAVKKGSAEPIVLSLEGVARQKKRASAKHSINLRMRQISSIEWSHLVFKDMNFRFDPADWKRPKPPRGFTSLIRRLDGSR